MNRQLCWMLVWAVACSSAPPEPVTPEVAPTTVASTSATAITTAASTQDMLAPDEDVEPPTPKFAEPPAPGPAPAIPPKTVRDPKIMKLVKAAASCKLSSLGNLDDECPGVRKFLDEPELFKDGKGNETMLSLCEDEDPKLRMLGLRGMTIRAKFFASKENAARLFHAALREKDDNVAWFFGQNLVAVDAEKLGLAGELHALARHPLEKIRHLLAFMLLPERQTALNLEIAHRLMYDPSPTVQESAVSSLSGGGRTPGNPEICALLGQQLKRRDRAGSQAHWTVNSSWCKDLYPVMLTSLEKRYAAADKSKNFDVNYELAALVCGSLRPEFSEAERKSMAKRAFALGEMLLEFKETMDRHGALRILHECDPVRARPILEKLTQDKDSFIAKGAKEYLGK